MMATEKRLDLISRNDLIKAVEAKRFAISDNTHPYEAIRIQGKYFREVVDNAPKVDAVEVVRCKNCKHAEINENHPNKPLICYLTRMCGTVKPDWYCWQGERKDND
jgi:hypothetical protein